MSAGERRMEERGKGEATRKWGKSYCMYNYYFSVGTGDVAVVIAGGIGGIRKVERNYRRQQPRWVIESQGYMYTEYARGYIVLRTCCGGL